MKGQDFAHRNGNMLTFPGREPIPYWRVLSDRILSPIIGIVLTFLFSNQILSAEVPLMYPACFVIIACICALIGLRSSSPAVRYSGLSLGAYFGFTALFNFAFIMIF